MNHLPIHDLIIWGINPFVLSFVALFFIRRFLIQQSIVDNPNQRSSHKTPTPRGGGLGFMPIFLIFAMTLGVVQSDINLVYLLSITAGLCFFTWFDDLRGLSARWRFLVQSICVLLALTFCYSITNLPFANIIPQPILYLLTFLAWVWFINLYNFMDGIDGIASIETLSILIGLILFTPINFPLLLILGSCVVAFFLWNKPPAKLFMGDIGSIGLGFFIGYLLLSLANTGFDGFLIALILPLYYLSDATITLFKRIIRKEKFWQAHREHFYQQATSHDSTSHQRANITILMCNLGLMLCAFLVGSIGWLALIPAVLIVGLTLIKFSRTSP